ncbi:hypothetical protein [Mesorhizobium sp. Root157]|uniref:hypothetical protein n=1 Tax=Mesorhizobium sp. Root157 TaxID=1736477 RepID=UPI000B1BAF55|nr:hypothetical protein [Mesorhizobium sp. Root157]
METIEQENYREQLKAFILAERVKSPRKPVGFFGNWAFHSLKEAEFVRKNADGVELP